MRAASTSSLCRHKIRESASLRNLPLTNNLVEDRCSRVAFHRTSAPGRNSGELCAPFSLFYCTTFVDLLCVELAVRLVSRRISDSSATAAPFTDSGMLC